jgi:regulatory protein
MNQLTTLSKANKGLYKAVFSNKVTAIITEKTMVDYNLYQGKELSDNDINKIVKSGAKDALYAQTLVFVTYQMRTISEVKKHLTKKGANKNQIDEIILMLKKNRYLDDKKYASEYIKEKIEFDLIGPKKIKQDLIKKGIHYDLMNQYLPLFTREIEQEKLNQIIAKETKYPIKKTYAKAVTSLKQKCVHKGFHISNIETVFATNKSLLKSAIDDQSLLDNAISKAMQKYDVTSYEERNKCIQSLMRKGFTYEQIITKLNEVV